MSYHEGAMQDALDDENRILEENLILGPYSYDDAKRLKKDAKINEQPPLVQKYWLGRLAYELAMRNEKVKAIIEKSKNLSQQVDYYSDHQGYSPQERFLVLSLHEYGFTAQPENNVLKTEHTSYPVRLELYENGYIEINTIFKIEKLLAILDGATAKKVNMNLDTHIKWKNIGLAYVESYVHIINIIEYQDDGESKNYTSSIKNEPDINIFILH